MPRSRSPGEHPKEPRQRQVREALDTGGAPALLDARGAEAFQALHGDEMLNQLVASAFDAYDRDLNAVLTFDEFLRWADANPAVQEILAVFGN